MGARTELAYKAGGNGCMWTALKPSVVEGRLESPLKPYWGKLTVRNFRGGRGNPKLHRARRAPLSYSALVWNTARKSQEQSLSPSPALPASGTFCRPPHPARNDEDRPCGAHRATVSPPKLDGGRAAEHAGPDQAEQACEDNAKCRSRPPSMVVTPGFLKKSRQSDSALSSPEHRHVSLRHGRGLLGPGTGRITRSRGPGHRRGG